IITSGDYIKWLRTVVIWEETVNVFDEFCQYVSHPTQRYLYDLFLSRSNEMKVYHIKCSDQVKIEEQMFTDKDLVPPDRKARSELREIYATQNWYDRNLPIVVAWYNK
ncbi:14211_t:CDS:2, partial [Ambispora leptoticha]